MKAHKFSLIGLAALILSSSHAIAAGFAGGKPWQIGDVVVCFGNGACNVLRIVNGTPLLLDQFSDGLLGQTSGVAINNTLHLLVTDNALSHSGSTSNVVEYTIASVNPIPLTATVIPHVSATTNPFNDSGSNAQAVVVNSAGQIFVGNAGSGLNAPSIAEIDPNGNLATASSVPPLALPVNPLPLPANCTDSNRPSSFSMDLSADGSSLYLTSGGPTIQKLTLSSGTCAPFANLGSNTRLFGIKDIPAGALSNVSSCNGTSCPSDEALLVVAIGNSDPDAAEPGESSSPDPDAINICTNTPLVSSPSVSCALLLDTSAIDPGLTTSFWHPGLLYNLAGSVLDPALKMQTVLTAGTSGTQEPAFSESGGTVIDNAVKWTDIVQPTWQLNHAYVVIGTTPAPNVAAVANTYFVDPNGNLETVTVPGSSGPTEPGTSPNPISWNTSPGGTTIDGLQWQDQGTWQPSHLFASGSPVGDSSGHVHTVLTAGTSASGALPAGGWNDSGGTTIDNAAIWTNQGPVTPYAGNTQYGLGTYVTPNGHVQKATEPGTSGGTTPNFSSSGGITLDNAVIWTDQGQEFWHPSFSFATGAAVVDAAGHVQLATTAGTSGPTQPQFTSNVPSAGQTTDGLQWTDLGAPGTRTFGTPIPLNTVILDSNTPSHVQQAVVAGNPSDGNPAFSMTGGYTLDGSVVWLDRGVNTYQANHSYNVGDAFSDGTDIQQATSAGISGASSPPFLNVAATVTPDNAVVWTDEGALTWQANFNYAATTPATTYIVDAANHVQQVTIAGTSGPAPPVFNDGGMTADATPLVWTDLGRRFWHPSVFTANAVIVDFNNHVQLVTTAGTSGPTQPQFTTNIPSTGQTTDGLQWTDQGTPATWLADTGFSANQFIVDTSSPTPHVQQVLVGGTSGAGPNPPSFSMSGGYTLDGTVVWIDRGLNTYQPNHPYNVGDAFSDGTDIQQATSAGSSSASSPVFSNVAAAVTPDNAVVWTDEGALTWQANFNYAATTPATTYILDPANHVQQVTAAGVSGSTIPSPFNDGGTVVDGLVWMDVGPVATWTANTAFGAGALVVDPRSFLQKVTSAGISTTPSQPTWNETVGGMTIDGLQWTDQGNLVWLAGHSYSQGALISDPAAHAQKVFEAGTSGTTAPIFNDAGSMTTDNAVIWTESHPLRSASQAYVSGAIVLDDFSPPNVQQVSLAGITGPSAVVFNDSGGTAIDGLQWKIQTTPSTSVVARYPVNGTTTLQPLSLDPLIADCTGSNCSNSLATPKISNFWLGDNQSANFYKLDFASGTPVLFNANSSCSGCAAVTGIQGLAIYGAEGANQPDLTKLATTALASGNSYTANVKFPLLVSPFTSNDVNSWTVTAYNLGTNTSPLPITLYASLIDKASAPPIGNNSGAADPGAIASNNSPEGGAPCRATTTDPRKCIIWKADLQLPALSASLAENISSPTGIDTGTDVFVDLHYDVTTAVGLVDPVGRSQGSVHSLNEISTTFTNGGGNASGCFYVSPAPNNACFKSNRGTLPFEFQCPGVPFSQFRNLANSLGPPLLSIVQLQPANKQGVKPAPLQIPLTTSNGKAPYRFNGTDYIFNWSPNGITGNFTACTFDPTRTVQTFCENFSLKASCP